MKLAFPAAALLALLGCEKSPSKLDAIAGAHSASKGGGTSADVEARIAQHTSQLEARIAQLEGKLGNVRKEALESLSFAFDPSQPGAAPAPGGAALTDNLTLGRIARLEKMLGKVDEESLEFLAMAFDQAMEQQTKPLPGKVYGVDIAQNVALGHVDGAPNALVTIVEAFDFA